MGKIAEFFESEIGLYFLGGLALLTVGYLVLNSGTVGALTQGLSNVADSLTTAVNKTSTMAATTINNAQTPNTFTNAIVTGALGPIGALWQLSSGLNQIDAGLPSFSPTGS
jgi:hypothetical protein